MYSEHSNIDKVFNSFFPLTSNDTVIRDEVRIDGLKPPLAQQHCYLSSMIRTVVDKVHHDTFYIVRIQVARVVSVGKVAIKTIIGLYKIEPLQICISRHLL